MNLANETDGMLQQKGQHYNRSVVRGEAGALRGVLHDSPARPSRNKVIAGARAGPQWTVETHKSRSQQ